MSSATAPITTPVDRFLDESKSLACIHCGLCLSSCPTYLETGNENDSPRGRIYQMRALQSGALPMNAETVKHMDLCLGCRACETACPSGVKYGVLLESTREYIAKNYHRGWLENLVRRVLIERVLPHRRRALTMLAPGRFVKWAGIEGLLPAVLRRFTELIPDDIEKHGPLPEYSPALGDRIGAVGFVSGCLMDVLFNRTNRNSIKLLNIAGYDVFTPRNQGCCGALHAHAGQLISARRFGAKLMRQFEGLPIERVVVNSAGCGSALKGYGHLFLADANTGALAEQFSGKVADLVEVLAASNQLIRALEARNRENPPGTTVTYHDACHLAHAQRILEQPRRLLRAAVGMAFVELPESEVCCGSAGSYNLTEPSMSRRLRDRKMANIGLSSAGIVVTTNPGCLLQMRAGAQALGKYVPTVTHLADFLVTALTGRINTGHRRPGALTPKSGAC